MSTTFKKSQNLTPSAKSAQNKKFVLIDATDLVVGRLAAKVASLLRGKNKTNFTPHASVGDFVIVINSDKIKFTSNKVETKKYWRHTGFPGGIKSLTPKQMFIKNKSDEIISMAVKGMLPKGPLGREMLRNLRVYNSDKHDNAGQNPELFEFAKQNRKNVSN